MEPPVDPIAQAWQSLWMALGGGVLYALLDFLVLRHNESFQRGRKFFRFGVGVLVLGVLLGGWAWLRFARADSRGTNIALYCSYGVRGFGLIAMIVGLIQMRRKDEPSDET